MSRYGLALRVGKDLSGTLGERRLFPPLVVLLVSALAGFIVLSVISAVMGVYELTGT